MTGLYVIAGMPRSGTTQMHKVVSLLGNFRNISEPSNCVMSNELFWSANDMKPDNLTLRKKIIEQATTVDIFVDLLEQKDIKVVKVIPLDSPCPHCGEFDRINMKNIKELIEHRGVEKVILLYRKDILRQALSCCISMKLNVWHGHANIIRNSVIGKLDAEFFRHMLGSLKNHNKYVKVLSRMENCKLCEYDDLYNKNGRQEFYWRGISEFLCHEYNKETIADVNSKRYNGPETYSKIENLQELKDIYFDFRRHG